MKKRIKRIIAITFFLNYIVPFYLIANSFEPIKAQNGMVVSASKIASEVGVKILQNGGNAVDAGVAVGFALAVVYPYAGNLGGGGFMVLHLENGKNTTIDYREKAPLASTKDMYLDKNGNYHPELSQEGATSVGVPGSVAGLLFALEKYGTLPLEKVIQPAIDLAKNGWLLNDYDANSFNKNLPKFEKYPSSLKIFTNSGKEYQEDDLFVQPDLAMTLEQIKKIGRDGFYKGKVAKLFVQQIQELGGCITLLDLEKYMPVERSPLIGTFREHKIISMPPPSSGGIALIELLNILENFNFEKNDLNSSSYINRLVETMKYVYADRTFHLGDEDFYQVPKQKLLSKEYAKLIFNKLTTYAKPSKEILENLSTNFNESTETTHYSVYDSDGNAVSVTTTINSAFGSKIVVKGAGFLLNNEMDDFSAKPGEPNQFGLLGSKANSIEPEKRMLSSMTPTIVLKNNEPYIIVGSPGGSTIITVVLQVILNIIDFDMNVAEAVRFPRIHHQWFPDKIYFEKYAINKDTQTKLLEMGYQLANRNNTFRILGSAQAIMIKDGFIYGSSDPRRKGGEAIGY